MTAPLPWRVLRKIDTTGDCWLWTGAIGDHGYGMVWDGRSMVGAHRYVYEHLVGAIPDGLHLDHVRARGCVHRHCVNPAHLEPVEQAENNHRARRDTCRRGHEWTDENTYIRPDTGSRQCRACPRERREAC